MSLLLVPATRENLEKSIEKPVDVSFAKKYLSNEFVDEVLQNSGIEGIRCWALTKTHLYIFREMQNGDEVLLSEKDTNLFTHYGIVIGKIQSLSFGKALWPFVGKNPWENIYFLANITKIRIPKTKLVTALGYKENYNVSGANRIKDDRYLNLGTMSQFLGIPVFDHIAEANEDKDFSGQNIQALVTKRLGHTKFSRKVKTNYNHSCAICGINETEFLVAGHISPWSEDPDNRLNPQNGICLCSFHDKAFEHGYIGISNDFRIILNPKISKTSRVYSLLELYENKSIHIPFTDHPDKKFLDLHRKKHNIL